MKQRAFLCLVIFAASFGIAAPGCDSGGSEAVIPTNLPPVGADEEAMMAEDRAAAEAASKRENMGN